MPARTHKFRKSGKALTVRAFQVQVIEGPDAGLSWSGEERMTVGTAEGNDLRLNDDAVSRFHLELVGTAEGVRLLDPGSTNGTRLGCVRVERAVLPDATEIELGRTRLRIGGGEARKLVTLGDSGRFGQFLGQAPVSRLLMSRLRKAAASEVAVLLIGESGTGKELIARGLHDTGQRHDESFVTVDCGALAPSLVASELFGHEKGAFTGASARRPGVFELANGGTLFLDEIGELSMELQTNLLGVLERRKFKRVGGHEELDTNIRIVSATNRDLRAAVNDGRFRLDLYYRIAIITLQVPPLRERLEDIPLLVEHFLAEWDPGIGADTLLTRERLTQLERHHWPGNVRELRNRIEAALAIGEPIGPMAEPRSTAPSLTEPLLPYKRAREQVVSSFEASYLHKLLERAGGNVSKAARDAHMNRSHLITMLKRHGLR